MHGFISGEMVRRMGMTDTAPFQVRRFSEGRVPYKVKGAPLQPHNVFLVPPFCPKGHVLISRNVIVWCYLTEI